MLGGFIISELEVQLYIEFYIILKFKMYPISKTFTVLDILKYLFFNYLNDYWFLKIF